MPRKEEPRREVTGGIATQSFGPDLSINDQFAGMSPSEEHATVMRLLAERNRRARLQFEREEREYKREERAYKIEKRKYQRSQRKYQSSQREEETPLTPTNGDGTAEEDPAAEPIPSRVAALRSRIDLPSAPEGVGTPPVKEVEEEPETEPEPEPLSRAASKVKGSWSQHRR